MTENGAQPFLCDEQPRLSFARFGLGLATGLAFATTTGLDGGGAATGTGATSDAV